MRLDVGCGAAKDGDIGLDYVAGPGVDVVHDLTEFPWPFADATFDSVAAHQVLEHLAATGSGEYPDLLCRVFDEVHRILKPGGRFDFDVPHVAGEDAFSDPSHRRFYNERSFELFWTPAKQPFLRRRPWTLEQLGVDRTYHVAGRVTSWHVRQRLPRLDRMLQRIGFGVPSVIRISLRRAGP